MELAGWNEWGEEWGCVVAGVKPNTFQRVATDRGLHRKLAARRGEGHSKQTQSTSQDLAPLSPPWRDFKLLSSYH
jgi:hypothetical protein